MNYKKIIENVIPILLSPITCIGTLLIWLSPLIGFMAIVWAFENWRISLPIIILLLFVIWCINKIRDQIDERKRKKKIELERQAACDYCKNHPELARPMKHQIISFPQYIKSLGWQKHGKGFVIENDDKQPCVVIYNITKKASSIIGLSSHGVQTIESFIFPIFDTNTFSETGWLVNLEESDIILVTTEDYKKHIYINPKTVSKEESEKIALSLYKQARSWCEGNGNEKDYKKQKDYHKAFLLFQEAAQMGNSEAQCCLGCCYSNSYGTQADYHKARFWYDKSYKNGCLRALRAIAISYENGQGVPQSYQKAVEWYTKAAEQGEAKAQLKLGVCFYYGRGVPQNLVKAVEWFTKAAKQGNASAQFNLGINYYYGRGVSQNYEKAVEWYTKAAKQGDASAQLNLGINYYCGRGVSQNYEKAVEWFTKAAEQGEAKAQLKLGVCFYYGRGVPQNLVKAVEWFTKAAEQGNANAQLKLGICLKYGRGVSQSYEKALNWLLKAAEQNDIEAQWLVARCYEEGTGVMRDRELATEWYRKAASQGHEAAQIALFVLETGFCIIQRDKRGKDCVQGVEEQRRIKSEHEFCVRDNPTQRILAMISKYDSVWEVVSTSKIDDKKKKQILVALVVSSRWGKSACFSISRKGKFYIPLEPMTNAEIGDLLNVDELELVTFEYVGEDLDQLGSFIYRIRIPEKKIVGINNNDDILNEYSREQQGIIKINEGHHLVLAPPGCGKTRVLAERVLYAIDKGRKMGDMLCLTFTNRAAREMKERIDNRVENKDIENLFVGNVHQFCSTLLRKNNVISQKKTIIDDEEKNVILQEIISRSLGIKITDVDEFYNYQHFLYQIKNNHPSELYIRPNLDSQFNEEEYKRVAREYLSYKDRYNLVDFEDLLLYGYDYLVKHQKEIKQYSWIQIDEVQDLNRLQLAIIVVP